MLEPKLPFPRLKAAPLLVRSQPLCLLPVSGSLLPSRKLHSNNPVCPSCIIKLSVSGAGEVAVRECANFLLECFFYHLGILDLLAKGEQLLCLSPRSSAPIDNKTCLLAFCSCLIHVMQEIECRSLCICSPEFYSFETTSYSVAQAGLELTALCICLSSLGQGL